MRLTFAQFIDLLHRVCLWAYMSSEIRDVTGAKQATNGTNDGSTAIVPSWLVLGVQLGEPLETSAASIEMVQGVGHLFVDEAEETAVE